MTHDDFKQLTAFARQDGFLVGLLWIFSFVCFILGFQNQLLMTVCMLLGIMTPFLAAKRLRIFRDDVRNGIISFRRALAYCVLIFFYASLIMATAIFVYFAFIDKGFIFEQWLKAYSQPEIQPLLKQIDIFMKGLLGITTKDIPSIYSAFRPIDFALESITNNLSIGIILSIPIAAIMKRRMMMKS